MRSSPPLQPPVRDQPGLFSEQNARAHVGMLAGTIGSRPVGTPANARARAYIIDQLRLFGFEVRVQDADARRASIGRTARVSNIIAIKPGRRSRSDRRSSRTTTRCRLDPGAADDAFGVAVSLEAARVLAARTDRNWTLMVIVTDGEEAGLMGAAAVVTDREVTSRLQAYINLESIGSGGPAMLFETGPGNGWLIGPWARHAPRRAAHRSAIEIYRRLPNDTDFSILKRQGIPGPQLRRRRRQLRLSHGARHAGAPVAADAPPQRRSGRRARHALDAVDITQRSAANARSSTSPARRRFRYGPVVGWVIAAAGIHCSASLPGCVSSATAMRLEGVWRWLLDTRLDAPRVGGSRRRDGRRDVGAAAAREVYHPWYARPDRLFLLLLAVGGTVGWGFVRLGHWLPARAHGMRHPLVVWSITLPVWIALAAAVLSVAPGAAFLWLLPLLIAGLLLSIVPPSSVAGVRAASGLVLRRRRARSGCANRSTCCASWSRSSAACRSSPRSSSTRQSSPAAGVMLVPPLIAAIARTRPLVRPALGTALCLLAVAITAGLAYVAPAYTHEQPLRRVARARAGGDGPAVWDVGSVEPGLDLGEGAPSGWKPAARDADSRRRRFDDFRSRLSSSRRARRSGTRRSRSPR